MRVCFLDFETTGKDPLTCVPLELGALGWEYDEKAPWKSDFPGGEIFKFQRYIKFPELKEIPQEIIELTGISIFTIHKQGMEPNQALIDFLHISTKCQYFIAHNVQYDAVVLAGFIDKFPDIKKRYAGHPAFNTQNWICTYNDVPYPARFRCKILSHLALDHGIEFGPNFKAHSALIDIELILKILIAGGYTLEKILAYKNDAWIYLQALVPTPWEDNGKGKEDAKAAGYSFETARGTTEPKFPKAWVKRIKSAALEEEKKIQVPFKRQILKLDDCYKK